MLVTQKFKNAIEKAFYDKVITILSATDTKEADGATKRVPQSATGTFKGNARLTNFKSIQKDYGLNYQIDIAITTTTDVPVTVGDAIEYAGIKYRVTDALPMDSHKLIVGAKWSSSKY